MIKSATCQVSGVGSMWLSCLRHLYSNLCYLFSCTKPLSILETLVCIVVNESKRQTPGFGRTLAQLNRLTIKDALQASKSSCGNRSIPRRQDEWVCVLLGDEKWGGQKVAGHTVLVISFC